MWRLMRMTNDLPRNLHPSAILPAARFFDAQGGRLSACGGVRLGVPVGLATNMRPCPGRVRQVSDREQPTSKSSHKMNRVDRRFPSRP